MMENCWDKARGCFWTCVQAAERGFNPVWGQRTSLKGLRLRGWNFRPTFWTVELVCLCTNVQCLRAMTGLASEPQSLYRKKTCDAAGTETLRPSRRGCSEISLLPSKGSGNRAGPNMFSLRLTSRLDCWVAESRELGLACELLPASLKMPSTIKNSNSPINGSDWCMEELLLPVFLTYMIA